MLKEEFETLIGSEVSPEDYKKIEFVYQWHPMIGNVGGKQQIANIYLAGGMEVIKDMMYRARKHLEYELKYEELQQKINELRKEWEDWEARYGA